MTTSTGTVFAAGAGGPWRIERVSAVVGAALPTVAALSVDPAPGGPTAWALRGVATFIFKPHRFALGSV